MIRRAATQAVEPVAPVHLSLDRLGKRYGNSPAVVSALSLAVKQGELVGLLGPSGCGKTTTMRMIAGLVPVSEGRISIAGRDVTEVPPYQRDIGLVFQSYALFPHLSVSENIAFGLEMRKLPRPQIRQRVAATLELVRLTMFASRKPRELSGGQQQRVALARALVIQPRILLLDEPLSNLDAKLREQMRVEIRDIQRKLGITTLFVTHDQGEALSICDRIAVLDGGRLEQFGTPYEIYERPATPFVAEFVGRANRLAGMVHGAGTVRVENLALHARHALANGQAVTVMVRPHRIGIATLNGAAPASGERNACNGSVKRATYVGDLVQYDVEVGGVGLQVECSTAAGTRTFAEGERVELAWSVADTLVFQAAS